MIATLAKERTAVVYPGGGLAKMSTLRARKKYRVAIATSEQGGVSEL